MSINKVSSHRQKYGHTELTQLASFAKSNIPNMLCGGSILWKIYANMFDNSDLISNYSCLLFGMKSRSCLWRRSASAASDKAEAVPETPLRQQEPSSEALKPPWLHSAASPLGSEWLLWPWSFWDVWIHHSRDPGNKWCISPCTSTSQLNSWPFKSKWWLTAFPNRDLSIELTNVVWILLCDWIVERDKRT